MLRFFLIALCVFIDVCSASRSDDAFDFNPQRIKISTPYFDALPYEIAQHIFNYVNPINPAEMKEMFFQTSATFSDSITLQIKAWTIAKEYKGKKFRLIDLYKNTLNLFDDNQLNAIDSMIDSIQTLKNISYVHPSWAHFTRQHRYKLLKLSDQIYRESHKCIKQKGKHCSRISDPLNDPSGLRHFDWIIDYNISIKCIKNFKKKIARSNLAFQIYFPQQMDMSSKFPWGQKFQKLLPCKTKTARHNTHQN